MKGNWETSVSENPQIKKCNRLTGGLPMAVNEEGQSQTTPSSSKAPKRSPNLEPIMRGTDVASPLAPRRPSIVSSSDQTCGHATTCHNSLTEKWLKVEGPHLGTIAHTTAVMSMLTLKRSSVDMTVTVTNYAEAKHNHVAS